MSKSAEQQARDMLQRCGVHDAQSFSAGDVVELANLIAEAQEYRHQLAAIRTQMWSVIFGDNPKTEGT